MFKQVDVFSKEPFKGNPLAVFLDGTIQEGQYQAAAIWTNLSETTFVTSVSNNEYHVRIYTPNKEIPFAGHPTLGTAHALIELGLIVPVDGKVIQHCGLGAVEIAQVDEQLQFKLPSYKVNELDLDVFERIEDAFGLRSGEILVASTVDVGLQMKVMELASTAEVNQIKVNKEKFADLADLGTMFVFYSHPGFDGDEIEMRVFFECKGPTEDPVTGSALAAVGAVLSEMGYTKVNIRQGRALGRDGHVRVTMEDGVVYVAGNVITIIDGKFKN